MYKNISNPRKAFFALGNISAFHGSLNPLSGRSIFETCIVPILLYGCEIWPLDSPTIKVLESFQCEIGQRILRLQNRSETRSACRLKCRPVFSFANLHFWQSCSWTQMTKSGIIDMARKTAKYYGRQNYNSEENNIQSFRFKSRTIIGE